MEEANRTLPGLAKLIPALQDRFRWLHMNRPTVRHLVSAYNIIDDSPVDPRYFRTLNGVRGLIHQAETLGVELKDIRTGLVDFPARLFGRDVLLCWKIGEREVRFWHDPQSGYAGRHRLPDLPPDSSTAAGDGS